VISLVAHDIYSIFFFFQLIQAWFISIFSLILGYLHLLFLGLALEIGRICFLILVYSLPFFQESSI
jgi:hypothetical protein